MKARKTLLGITACCAVLCAAASLAACHEHVWDDGEVTVAAHCGVAGQKTFHCECGETKTEEIDALGHQWVEQSGTPATCTADAVKVYSCECGDDKTETVAESAFGHHFVVESTTPASCGVAGNTRYYCDNDGCTETKNENTDALTHEKGAWEIETVPGQDTDGKTVKKCVLCDEVLEEKTLLSIEAAGNAYKSSGSAATCTVDGEMTYEVPLGNDESVTFNVRYPATAHKNAKSVSAGASTKNIITLSSAKKPFKSLAHYKCPDCNKIFTDASCAFESTAIYNLIRWGIIVEEGENKIAFQSAQGAMFFQAETGGRYTFKFSDLRDSSGVSLSDGKVSLIYYLIDEVNPAVVYSAGSSGWFPTAAAFGKIENNSVTPTDTVVAQMKAGECITIVSSARMYAVTVTRDVNLLSEGDNTVELEAGNWSDGYEFVSETNNAYSLEVPEGVEVVMNGNDLISDTSTERWANFNAPAGTKVRFEFRNSTTGAVTVKIGDERLQTLSLDGSKTVALYGKQISALKASEELESGTYKIVLESGSFRTKRVGDGYALFQVNGDRDYEKMSSDTGLMLGIGQSQVKNGWTPYCTAQAFTVTLTLNAGDLIYLAPVSVVAEGKYHTDVTVSLQKVD